ncbi:pyrroline-5-carboxylate reductase [Cupriavidus sp. UYPR2.512]|uniref:pyrroline-5-carboxylate reductase n=1 Tax=Cupriavidus sp. UYPR2.512 TaxID=1080187 RepID=UPI00036828EE|nr:pyrroline-5-carboxylate reductase [Cupriavidus sp. UYPR2.512]UIF90052.1 pyrroline-5-carboxylate reductase [Cupriavidus necator]
MDTQAHTVTLSSLTFGFVGGGNMATALISGLIEVGVPCQSIRVCAPSIQSRAKLHAKLKVQTTPVIDVALASSDVIVLAIKPQTAQFVLKELCELLGDRQDKSLIVSVVAGITLEQLETRLGTRRLIRAMPNTPSQIGMGMTGLVAAAGVQASDCEIASAIASAVGQILWLNEDALMNAVTALSGSGPAYVFYFIEAMEHAAEQLGLSPEQGKRLAIETFLGSADLARRTRSPIKELRQRVTSPGGTTEAATSLMDKLGVQEAFSSAILAAAAQGQELSLQFQHDWSSTGE